MNGGAEITTLIKFFGRIEEIEIIILAVTVTSVPVNRLYDYESRSSNDLSNHGFSSE